MNGQWLSDSNSHYRPWLNLLRTLTQISNQILCNGIVSDSFWYCLAILPKHSTWTRQNMIKKSAEISLLDERKILASSWEIDISLEVLKGSKIMHHALHQSARPLRSIPVLRSLQLYRLTAECRSKFLSVVHFLISIRLRKTEVSSS